MADPKKKMEKDKAFRFLSNSITIFLYVVFKGDTYNKEIEDNFPDMIEFLEGDIDSGIYKKYLGGYSIIIEKNPLFAAVSFSRKKEDEQHGKKEGANLEALFYGVYAGIPAEKSRALFKKVDNAEAKGKALLTYEDKEKKVSYFYGKETDIRVLRIEAYL